MRPWPLIALLPLLLAATPAAPTAPTARDAVRRTWTHLPETTNHCDDVFDYFPGGGLRILYCHAKEDLLVSQIAELAGVPIWVGGPHSRPTGLDLQNHADFGRYNPTFVRKIPEFALPAAKDTEFRRLTQPTWDRILQSRARIAWAAHRKLATDSKAREAEIAGYKANMKSAQPDPYYIERWYDFVETPDGNVAKSLVGWWLRRWMDGTEDEWAAVLRQTMELYDAAWIAEHEPSRKPQ